jgi:hypothetical protein
VLLRLLDYWDVCVATAIAVVGMFAVAVLKLSPLLLIIIGLAFFRLRDSSSHLLPKR